MYGAMVDDKTVGGAILFEDEQQQSLYVGRIFIDSCYHRMGYGTLLMAAIENEFSHVHQIDLDTPCWNVRTNAFYKKLGYETVGIEDGFVLYQKKRGE